MFLILTLFLFFFISPLKAWAYFDPGFGGYLVNSIISLIVAGFAFVSAVVIYFFRTIIGQKLFSFWLKHQKLCIIILLYILNLGSAALGAFFYYIFHKSFFFILLLIWAYFDSSFGKFFAGSIIFLTVFGFAFISAVVIYWQRFRRLHTIILLSVLCLVNAFLGAFLYKSSAHDPQLSRVSIIDSQRMFKGYNLYDGYLIDEKGRIIKQWFRSSDEVIDKNGDFYAGQDQDKRNHKEPSWGRYTWDDKVIWEKHFPIHHELYLSPKGTIFTFTKEPHNYNNYKVDFDIILEFDKNGNQLQRYSFWDHLKEFQPYHAKFGIDAAFFPGFPLIFLWQTTSHTMVNYDYFHINSFFMVPPNPLEGKNPAFRPGNWLISILHGNMVFILDQNTKKILWHAVANEIEGGLEGQHSASMLPDGNILLFDNGTNRMASRILIIDPLTLKIKWQYKNMNFFSPWAGFVQALPNGNFLVTDSMKGHVFELTPDKNIVWDYYNNHANLYRMTRYPKEMIDRLLQKGGS